jgi:hypothetical protein
MKNHKIIIICIAFLFFNLIFNACQKSDKTTNESLTENQIILERIKNFINEVDKIRENPDSKNTYEIEVEEAIWDIEAALNYTSTNAHIKENSDISAIKFIKNMPTVNGKVNMIDLINIYDSFKIKIDSIVKNNRNVQIFVADVYVKEDNGKDILLGLSLGLSTSLSNSKNNYLDALQHNWYYGIGGGRCDGTAPGHDAASVIRNYLNASLIEPPVGARWISIDGFLIEGGPYCNLFYQYDYINTGADPCVTSDMLWDYIETVQFYTNFFQPNGKQLIFRDYQDQISFGVPTRYHDCLITYGVILYGGIDF